MSDDPIVIASNAAAITVIPASGSVDVPVVVTKGPQGAQALYVAAAQPSVPLGVAYLWVQDPGGGAAMTLWLEDGT